MSRARVRSFLCGAALCVWLLSGTSLPAQTTKLLIEQAPTMPALVDNRPALTEWMVSVQGPGLVEGRLELTVVANGQLLGSVLTDELVFNGVDQKLRILLPPLNWHSGTDEILVNLRVLSKYGVIRLPAQRLRTSTTNSRKFPLLIGETKQRPRATAGRDKLADRLRFEAFFPEELKDRAITVMSQLPAGEFPQEPLSYCHYEAVLVADDVFAALRAPQLEALLNWVRAGGSLYLEPRGILENAQLDFLNRLAADDPRNLVFTLDSQGHLPKEIFFADDEFLHLHAGLGTAAVGLPAEENALAESQWQRVHATLWKLRDDQRDEILAHKVPSGLTRNQFGDSAGGGASMDALQWHTLASPAPTDTVYGMVDWLRPTGVRMVPLWVIAALLTTLVVLIGPVDYLTLTWLKRRKWTWITFPVAVVVMTGLTMWITNLYLSSAESRRAFVLHDIGRSGELLRTNRFELVFTSATRKLASDVQSALFTPLLTSGNVDPRFVGRLPRNQRVAYVPGPNGAMVPTIQNVYGGFGSDITSSEPVTMQGRVPSRYRVLQEVRQWTPQLNRTLSIGPTADAAAIDWAALQIPAVTDVQSLRQWDHPQLLERVRRQFGPSANYAVYSAQAGLPHEELVHASDPRLAVQGSLHAAPAHFNAGYGFDQEVPLTPQMIGFHTMQALIRLTSVPPQGLAALTTRTSPHGGRSLDDLSLHVTGAANRWWLVILVPQGDDIVVYRKSDTYPR